MDDSYIIFNFKYTGNDNQKNEENFEKKHYKYDHKYLISQENYEDGFNFLNGKNKTFNKKNIFYYCEFQQILADKNYVLVDEKFLSDLNCDQKFYHDKYVDYFKSGEKHFIYFLDNEILELSEIDREKDDKNDENEVLDEQNKNDEYKENNKVDKKEGDEEIKQKIIKSLILLYANDIQFQKLLNSPIVDEYDFKEYYLINQDFIEEYQKDNYETISEVLISAKYNYSYNGFCYNLDKIMKIPQIKKLKIKSKTYEEKKFYPYVKKFKFINKEMKVCPDKFILVPENLFDLIYNNIKKENYPKEDYKMKALIGDGLLFLQGKQNSCQFPIFRHNGKKFKLYYYLSLDEQSSFFDEVNKFIKGFGLFNYIIERNLDIEPKEKINDLKNNKKQSIGKYINIRKIEKDEINEFKFRTKIYNLKNIAYSLNAFTDNLWNMEENNFNLKDINNICKKIKNEEISYIKVGIILNNDLITLKEKIFYNDINDLIRYEGKQEYEKKEKKIIKKLTERDEDDIRTFGENLLIYNPKNLDKDKEKNYDYNFINFNIKSLLSESEDDEDLPESYYFANKGEYFIIFPSKKKVYKIDHDKEQDNFKLEEINNEDLKKNGEKKIDFKIFAKNINDLDKNEKDIISKIKLNFKNIFSMEKYYLVSSKWIKIFKDQFKGSKNIKIEQLDDYLLNEDNLRPNNVQDDINYDKETPNDFVIIMESLFKEILDNMNSLKKNLKLHSEYLYEVSFGDELIFIKELKTNDIFIYSFDEEEEKYKIKYILFLEKNQDIKELLKACKDFKEFLNNYNLNLTTQKIQIIETLKKINKKKKQKINIGTFKCIHLEKIEEPEPEPEPEPESEKPSHCLGLENIGATCYMNATIQCLCHVSKFKNYFLDGNLINNVTQDKNCPLTKEFASLVNHLWTLPKNNNNKSYYTPTSFKNIISQMNPLFEGIAANDSKDLILFIYENIHREINSIPYNFIQYNLNNCNNDIELVNFRNTYYPANSSILVDTFYFEQQSFLQCYSCNCIKISYSIVNMLIFPLEKVRQYVYKASNGQKNDVDIDLCFKHNQLGENLTGQNQIYCNQCGRTSDAITTNFIYTSPEALTIILNRGQGLEFNVNFKLDYYINIDNYVRIKTPGKSNI